MPLPTGPAQPQICVYAILLRRDATINQKKQGIIIVAMVCVVALLGGVFVIGWHVGNLPHL